MNTANNGLLSVEIDQLVNGEVIWGGVTITGTASGAVQVGVSIDGGPFHAAPGTDAWTYTFDASVLTPSNHTLTARAGDGAGHFAETSACVIANPESPPAPACGMLWPGEPLPYPNAAAPARPCAPPKRSPGFLHSRV